MYPEEAFTEDFQQENSKHLRDYLRIILKRKGLLITVSLITFLTTALFTFSKIPIYTATTQVLVEKNLEKGRLEGLSTYMAWDPDFQATQFQLIRSFNVALRLVKNQQLDTKYKHYFLSNKPSTPALLNLIKGSVSSFVSTTFSAVESFFYSLISPDLVLRDKDTADIDTDGNAKIQSEPESDAEKIAAMIQAGLELEPVRDTKIVNVSYSNKNPEVARMVANGIVRAYIDVTLDIKTSTTRQTLNWMTGKADDEQKKLEASEKALQKYMREHDIVTVENKLTILPERLSRFSNELSGAQAQEREYAAVYNQIKKIGKKYDALESLPLFADNTVLQTLRNQIFSSEQSARELSKKYGKKHPLMKKARAERQLLREKKRIEIKRIIDSTKNGYDLAKTKVKDLAKMMAETKTELLDMNERFIQYTILNRDKEMNRTIYDALSSSIKKTNITAQSLNVRIWAVKEADLPVVPSKPNKQRELTLGLMLGLCGGAALIFFLEYLDNTANSGQDIEDRYKLTVLGSVEDMSDKKQNIETFIQDNPLSALAESYRLIRSGLLLSTPDHPPHTLLITSMMQQEGKTTTTKNLAHVLSQNDKTVLIVDCDMRRPRQHSIFGIDNTYGLSNYLSGNTDEQQPTLIRQIEDTQISLIPSGPVPPNPAELLSSKRMELLVNKTKGQFDFVLLDSPPVQQVTDSLMLGPLVDGTVIVIKAGKTTYDMLDSGIKKLREGHAHILGFVLNRLKKNNAGQGYYGYYSYYSSKKGGYYTERNGKK